MLTDMCLVSPGGAPAAAEGSPHPADLPALAPCPSWLHPLQRTVSFAHLCLPLSPLVPDQSLQLFSKGQVM